MQQRLGILDQLTELGAAITLCQLGRDLVEPLDDFLEVLVASGERVGDGSQMVQILPAVEQRIVGVEPPAGEPAAQ